MSTPDRLPLHLLKLFFGSAAGVYAVVQAYSLGNRLPDGRGEDPSHAAGSLVGSVAGLVVGWVVCLVLLVPKGGMSRGLRLLFDVVKILLGLAAGLFAYGLVNNLMQQAQAAGRSGGSPYTVWWAVGAVVTGVACLLLLWSAYRRSAKPTGLRGEAPPLRGREGDAG